MNNFDHVSYCAAWREKKKLRAEARIKILEASGLNYWTMRGIGPRLRIECKMMRIDFWPTTGLWRILKTGERGKGIVTLLARIG